MTTETIDTQNAVETGGDEPARRPARRRRTADAGPAPRTRGRGANGGGEDLVASLTEMVDRLIEENRELKRALARAERTSGGPGLGQAGRVLSGLQRRVSRALDSATARRGRGAAAPAAAPRPRRKVTDPEVLERRRQALVKARAARLAKRQAQAG